MFNVLSTSVAVALALQVVASPTPSKPKQRRDTYVSDISDCPALTKRTPTSVHDLRPDDFSVAIALGDSITAAFLAKGIQTGTAAQILTTFDEWRGVSYAGGGDSGAITLPNLIKNYNSALVGGAVGEHGVELCYGLLCPIGDNGWDSTVDQLNAAQSGALASNIPHEVKDYLVPMVKSLNISSSAFKYLNLQIGSNDMCGMCVSALTPAGADSYEASIRSALEYVRTNIPNTVVNIVTNIPVYQIYNLTYGQTYCEQLIPDIPHYNIECACALLSGTAGDTTRALMKSLQDQYDARLQEIALSYQQANYSDFAVILQPLNATLADFPIDSLSDVDCFHPSEKTHQRLAVELWNRLPLSQAERAEHWDYPEDISIRCLEEDDRIDTYSLL